MRKFTVLNLLCLAMMLPSSVLAQQYISIPHPGAKTVMVGSDCDLSNATRTSDTLGKKQDANSRSLKMESKTPGKAVLRGTWDVKTSRFEIEVHGIGASRGSLWEQLAAQFSEHSNAVLDLDDKTFETNSFSKSEKVANKFWCIDSTFSDFSTNEVNCERQLWMGINPSYFDGLYTVHISNMSHLPYKATIKYYLRCTRRQ